MISPKSYEKIATYLEKPEKVVFSFTADWYPDYQFIYPVISEIGTRSSEFIFIRVDRDDFMEVTRRWNIFGIPSFIVTKSRKEIGHLVDKLRKTKTEINNFLAGSRQERK